MTAARAGQGGAEALLRVIPPARASEAGVETLFRIQTPLAVAQGGAEALHRVQPEFAVSQAGAEYLFRHRPCGTRDAQLWRIERADGVIHRFTSLDRDLAWQGEIYRSCGSLDPSASEAAAGVEAAGSLTLAGAVGPGGIDAHDLFAGLYDGARAEAWLVPWDGAARSARLLASGTLGRIEQVPGGFSAELAGDGARLRQTPLLRPVSPECRWLFGDAATCGADLAPLTVTGTIETAVGVRAFRDSARGEAAGYFRRGRVTFTSGDNAGITAEIKEHDAGGRFTLWPRLPFALVAGDGYSMVPGCTNTPAGARGCNGCAEWGRLARFGGFAKAPGGDARGRAAVQRGTS